VDPFCPLSCFEGGVLISQIALLNPMVNTLAASGIDLRIEGCKNPLIFWGILRLGTVRYWELKLAGVLTPGLVGAKT
jgi:hypothetical protein